MRISKHKIDSDHAEFNLCRDTMKSYNIKRILGHNEISPGRESEPGPAILLDELGSRLLQTNRNDMVIDTEDSVPKKGNEPASALNFGSISSFSSTTIAKPVSKNTEVSILKEPNGWYNVDVTFHGRVSKNYIHDIE